MAGYTRQSAAEIVTGAEILALPLNLEFNALAASFHGTTGHPHDGLAGNGPLISLVNSVTGVLPLTRGGFGGIHKTNATSAPTVNDDSGDGYAVGSHWVDVSSDTVYTAIDVTPGASVWLAQADFSDTGYQWASYDADGIIAQIDSGQWASRTIVAPAAGMTISHGNGVTGNPTIALANDLAALEGLSTSGITVRSATDTWITRSIAVSGNGLSVSNGNGIAGNPTITIGDDLAAIEALDGTGLYTRTGTNTWAARQITTTGSGLTVTNGTGAGGNPTLALADDVAALENISSNGIAVRNGTSSWVVRNIAGTTNEITVTNGSGASSDPTISLPAALTFTGKTITGGAFTGGTWQGVIGGGTPAAGTFTTVTTSGDITVGNDIYISGGSPTIYFTDTDTGGDSYISASSSTGSIVYAVDTGNEVAGSEHVFEIDGTRRAYITPTNSGEITVNTIRLGETSVGDVSASSTTHPLQIGLSSGANVAIDNNELFARNNGAVASFGINGTVSFTAAGALTCSGDITAFSDIRVKKNIKKVESALDKVSRMEGITFDRVKNDISSAGVVAQELQKIAPELVKEDADGMLSVNYGGLAAYFIEAIKELKELTAKGKRK